MRANFFPASLTDLTPSWKSWGILNQTSLFFAFILNLTCFLQGAGYERRKEDPSPHGRTWVCALLFRSLRVSSFPYTQKQKNKQKNNNSLICRMNKEWHCRGIRQPSRSLCHRVRGRFSDKHQLSMQLPRKSREVLCAAEESAHISFFKKTKIYVFS